MGAGCKPVGVAYGGSNPPSPTLKESGCAKSQLSLLPYNISLQYIAYIYIHIYTVCKVIINIEALAQPDVIALQNRQTGNYLKAKKLFTLRSYLISSLKNNTAQFFRE